MRCFKDSTQSSCPFFGSSGSGVVRPFQKTVVSSNFTQYDLSEEQFAWVGTLSMSKGCDQAVIINGTRVSLGAENPGIFTDGACYLDWIAKEYGLQIDPKLRPKKELCLQGSGDLDDADRTGLNCRTNRWRTDRKSYCIFSKGQKYEFQVSGKDTVPVIFDTCKLFGVEG